jgi:hypothetical protein
VWIIGILAFLVWSIYCHKNRRDPKEELLKAKQLVDEGLIEQGEYEKLKTKLLKKIVDEY